MQDYVLKPIRSAAILTTSYVAGTVITPTDIDKMNPALKNQMVVLASLTLGSLTSAQLKVEFSPDGVTYYQETFGAISGGTQTLSLGESSMTTSGNFRIPIPVKDQWIKISVKGTGTVTNSSMTVDAVMGIA